MLELLNTPWRVTVALGSLLIYPYVRMVFLFNRIPWGRGWRFHGVPLILKHRQSEMRFGDGLGLRSWLASNPLGPNHAVVLCTWLPGARLLVGEHFAMTGGAICATNHISIGNHVTIGANSTIVDTDFHPLDPDVRRLRPQDAASAPVVIEDDVFIGMNAIILKGVTLGKGCVIGAGSVVSKDVPARTIAAGNPARIIREM